jgi:hypothetical protein
MNIEIVLGAIILAAWAGVVLWSLGQTALSATRGQASLDYVIGLIAGCISGAGVMMMFHPHDASLFGAGFVLALCGTVVIWVRQHGKLDEKLQTTALGILEEMIRKELLTVSVHITDPPAILACRVREAIVAGSRSATQEEITREIMTGKPIKQKTGQGIELLLNHNFRLATGKEEQQLRDAIGRN